MRSEALGPNATVLRSRRMRPLATEANAEAAEAANAILGLGQRSIRS